MAALGVCWANDAWVVPSWETEVWCPEAVCIPESIGDCWEEVWCQGTWQSNVWCPTTPPQPVTTNVMIGGVPVQDLSYWRKKRIWNDDDEFIARQLHDV